MITDKEETNTTLWKHLMSTPDPNTHKPLFEVTERSNNNSILFVFLNEHTNSAKEYINNMKKKLTEIFITETH